MESKLNLPDHWKTQFQCSLESTWNHKQCFDRRRQIFHTSLFTDEVDSWSRRNEGHSAYSVGMFASGVEERSSWDSLGCVSREDWHISISHRLIAVFTITENEKNKFSRLLPAIRKRTYSSMLRDNKIFVNVICSLPGAVWLQSNLRQILFFSSPAGNGMEEKTEPAIMKTLRGRKDTLIAENKYPLRKVTVCDRRKNAYSISGWELLLSIDNQIPLMRMNISVKP